MSRVEIPIPDEEREGSSFSQDLNCIYANLGRSLNFSEPKYVYLFRDGIGSNDRNCEVVSILVWCTCLLEGRQGFDFPMGKINQYLLSHQIACTLESGSSPIWTSH